MTNTKAHFSSGYIFSFLNSTSLFIKASINSVKGGVDATLYTNENSIPSVKLSPAYNDTEDYYLSSFGIAIGSEESEQQDRSSYIIDESTGEVTGNLPAITDNALASELEYDESLKVIVVNNEDALLEISENKDTLECIKKLCSKYKMLNVVVIFGNVLNEQANNSCLKD